MALSDTQSLPAEQQIALAHTPAILRDALRIFFELDLRLSRIVAATSEPMLGQMRLAWWREMLAKPPEERPRGDAVLDGIGAHWAGEEASLVKLVDGWEHMLAAELHEDTVRAFAAGRAAPLAALANRIDPSAHENCERSARRWAYADAAIHIPPGDEREALLRCAQALPKAANLPSELKGLAVLDALARRSLSRNCRPLMEGRGASLVATRAAIFGR